MSTEKFTVPPTVVVAKLIEMKAIEILKNKKVEYMIFAECEEEWCEEEGGEGFWIKHIVLPNHCNLEVSKRQPV